MNTTDRASEPRSATRNVVVALVVAVIVIGLDQLTKAWAVRELSDGHTIDLIGSLRFNLAFNTGASFSIGSGLGPLFSAIVVVVVVLLLRYAREVTNPVGLVAVGMVVGGAVGNVLDRIFRAGVGDDRGFLGGAVVDFVDLQWWPIFNIADIGVVCGGLLLVISAWIHAEDDMADDAPDAAADDSSTAD